MWNHMLLNTFLSIQFDWALWEGKRKKKLSQFFFLVLFVWAEWLTNGWYYWSGFDYVCAGTDGTAAADAKVISSTWGLSITFSNSPISVTRNQVRAHKGKFSQFQRHQYHLWRQTISNIKFKHAYIILLYSHPHNNPCATFEREMIAFSSSSSF